MNSDIQLSPFCHDKSGLIRVEAFLVGEQLSYMIYYLRSTEICPDKRGGLIRRVLLYHENTINTKLVVRNTAAQKNPPEKISKLGRYWSATVNIFTFFIFAFNMGIFTLKESGKEASLLFSLIRFAGWFDSWLLYWFLT